MKNRQLIFWASAFLVTLAFVGCQGSNTPPPDTTEITDANIDTSQSTNANTDKVTDAVTDEMTDKTTDALTENDTTDNKPTNKGTAMINDIYAWVGYPASDFYVHFDNEKNAQKLTYTYDTSALQIDAEKQTVKALKAGKYVVNATSEDYSVSFTVNAQNVDKNAVGSNGEKKYYASKYSAKVSNRISQYSSQGTDSKTTVFIGDSFFDTDFWSNFYSAHYPTKDALLLGISATTSYDWETWAQGWLGDISPKNIVMHMGTNNLYDDGDDIEGTVSALERMFTVMHQNLPDTKIYWFGISYRAFNATKISYAKEINKIMEQWCSERDYITYIDTPSQLTNDMLKDSTHPKLEYYTVFTQALSKTDIQIEGSNMSNSEIKDISYTTSQMIKDGTGNTLIRYKGATLTKNYIIEGKLDITKTTTNTHLHFAVFDGTNNRILLWDNQNDGNFKLAIPYDTVNVPKEDIYKFTSGNTLTLEWKLVVTDNDAYFFIGNELKLVYAGYSNSNELRLGSEGAESRFYDMTVITKAADSAEFDAELTAMSAIIEQYDKNVSQQKIRA